ncbi:Predicted arabinose efflux permease, MFS family [Pseudooceanicola antarcticus]|uniref:MFS transporter n=1 Tax=Pseudooceanicola antarcticus TaxID=1247613 RepID=A0A285J6J4_9RHOB|nr:MFS transporter [Pseudooceanicola antarcticus]PJE26939.1 MFS transporter [Pseudooceanicola antarcticus]SNY55832.1 Predicted arabinose efflux permease, MFS family [Pseudooceanicola antarcticus]
MLQVLGTSWALLLGLMLLMLGNGLQGTLLGVRGEIEGFSTFEMSLVMSAYFAGFLGGSRLAPEMIRRVGHVRVFAALGSFISAVLILYPAYPNPWAWSIERVIIGFCFSGVYVTAESWLNNAASNENRGKSLALYMIVQVLGIMAAQGILLLGDPAGFILFIVPSILVSISFAPILLSISPTPAFETTRPMSLKELFQTSPLSLVGVFLVGGAFSAQFGMAAVFGTQAGLTLPQISLFITMFYLGAVLSLFPLGWLSDRMDRRLLIAIEAIIGGVGAGIGWMLGESYVALLVAALFIGGMTNPLYSLLLAYLNDLLEHDQMAAGSAGMMFVNGLGAIGGPILTGYAMTLAGPGGFFLFIAVLLLATAGYAFYRMTQRPSVASEDTGAYAPVFMSSTPVAVEAAQEWAYEVAEEAAAEESET